MIGVVYLLHFERKLSDQAQHYLGWAKGDSAAARLRTHILGKRGAKIVKAAIDEGIGFDVALTIEGVDRNFERWLKNLKMANRFCPSCSGSRGIKLPPGATMTIFTPGSPRSFRYRVTT